MEIRPVDLSNFVEPFLKVAPSPTLELLQVQVVGSRTRLDVQWQDGTLQRSIASKDLLPVGTPLEGWPLKDLALGRVQRCRALAFHRKLPMWQMPGGCWHCFPPVSFESLTITHRQSRRALTGSVRPAWTLLVQRPPVSQL